MGRDVEVPPGDASIRTDGGERCEQDQSLILRSAGITSIGLLGGDESEEGQTVRVSAGFELGGCVSLAAVTAVVDETQKLVTLQAWTWTAVGADVSCTGELAWYEEILELVGLHAGTWIVLDGLAFPGGPSVTFTVKDCAGDWDCFCAPGSTPSPSGPLAECYYDCDCEVGLRCSAHFGFVGAMWLCARSCSVSADCAGWEECMFAMDGPYGVCVDRAPEPACPSAGCPQGQVCMALQGRGSWCQPDFDVWRSGETCECDGDCSPSLRCIDAGSGESAFCGAPCRGNLDCPPSSRCADDPTVVWALPICQMLPD